MCCSSRRLASDRQLILKPRLESRRSLLPHETTAKRPQMSGYVPFRASGGDFPPGGKRSRPLDQSEQQNGPTGQTLSNGHMTGGQTPRDTDWLSLLFNETNDRLLLLSSSLGPTSASSGILSKWIMTPTGFQSVQRVEPLLYPPTAGYENKRNNLKLGRGTVMCRSTDGNVVCGFDRGLVLSFDEKLDEEARIPVHEDRVTGLVSGNSGRFITSCSFDQSIAQVDVKTAVVRKRITNAHRSHVTSVDSLPADDAAIFLTCGKDGAITQWDFRVRDSGFTNFAAPVSCPTAVSFCRKEEYFVVGTRDGIVCLYDRRCTVAEVQSTRVQGTNGSRVYRLKRLTGITNDQHNDLMAIISDDPVLAVMRETSLDFIYTGIGNRTSDTTDGRIRDVEVVKGQVVSVGLGQEEFTQHNVI